MPVDPVPGCASCAAFVAGDAPSLTCDHQWRPKPQSLSREEQQFLDVCVANGELAVLVTELQHRIHDLEEQLEGTRGLKRDLAADYDSLEHHAAAVVQAHDDE